MQIKNTNSDKKQEKVDDNKENGNRLVIGFKSLRNFIGLAGIILPFWLIITAIRLPNERNVLPSISDYYHSSSGDVFVVILALLAAFLIFYKGYDITENILTTLAGVCVLMVAFFPTAIKPDPDKFATSIHTGNFEAKHLFGNVEYHFIFAGTFFFCITVMCMAYFPKSTKEFITFRKKIRNILYYVCGIIMAASVIGIIVYAATREKGSPIPQFSWIFWLETVALSAFGIAWLTKGETLIPDNWEDHYIVGGMRRLSGVLKGDKKLKDLQE